MIYRLVRVTRRSHAVSKRGTTSRIALVPRSGPRGQFEQLTESLVNALKIFARKRRQTTADTRRVYSANLVNKDRRSDRQPTGVRIDEGIKGSEVEVAGTITSIG
jgi:hypothetical protein